MKAGCVLLMLLLLGACAARTVRCDRRLTPINAPAKASAEARSGR